MHSSELNFRSPTKLYYSSSSSSANVVENGVNEKKNKVVKKGIVKFSEAQSRIETEREEAKTLVNSSNVNGVSPMACS